MKSFEQFSPTARSRLLKTVAKVVTIPHAAQIEPVAAGTEHAMGASFRAKASHGLRVLFDRDQGQVVLKEFTRRGNKRLYRRER